ncbi:MAG: helix-turn-helix domain-containing protein [Gammaproteobacteria bacterium]
MLKRVPYAHKEAFLRLLKNVRLEAELTQTELAKRLGQPQNFVSLYERGVRRLDVLELREVCKALELPLTTFIRRMERHFR